MSVTIRALLDRPQFALRLLTVPGAGQDALRAGLGRPLSWGYSTDLLDPTPFLRGGELVLTTGQQLYDALDPEEETRAYVSRLAEGGAAGLVYTLERPRPLWEDRLFLACQEASLPLLRAPFSTPFMAISEAVSEGREDPRRAAERRALQAQHALTLAALEHDAVQAIVREVAVLLGCTVVVHSGTGRAIAQAGDVARSPEAVSALRAAGQHRSRRAVHVSVGDVSLTVQSLTAPSTHDVLGTLTVARDARSAPPLDRDQRMIVNSAVAMLQLVLDARPPEALEADEVAQAGVRALLAGEPVTGLRLLARSGLLGAAPDGSAALLTAVVSARPLPQRLGGVRVALSEVWGVRGWVAVFAVPAADARLRAAVEGAGAVGVEGVAPVRLAAAARVAAGLLQGPAARGGRWLGLDGALLAFALGDDALGSGVAGQLVRLARSAEVAHPGQRLVETFTVWWMEGLQWQRAAERLGVHRNTVMRRVRLLGQAVGRDLEADADARAMLRFALLGAPTA